MSEGRDSERLWLEHSDEGNIEEVMTESEREKKKSDASGTEKPGNPKKDAEPSEGVVWEGKPTLNAFYSFYLIGCLTAFTGTVAELIFPLPPFTLGLLVPFVAAMFVLPLAFQMARTYILTDREISSRFSFIVERSKSAPIGKVTDVTARQGFVGRLLGFGSVRIDTAGTPFPGVKFWGVANPFVVRDGVKEVVKEDEDGEE